MKFFRKNPKISFLVGISSAVVIAYQLSYNLPEWYCGAGRHFTMLYNIAMAIIGSFIFFIFLNYIPQQQKNKAIRLWVFRKYVEIISSINLLFQNLSELYIGTQKNANECNDKDIETIACNLRNSDIVPASVMFKGSINVSEMMETCKNTVSTASDNIICNYSEFLTPLEIDLLSMLTYGKMHTFLNGINKLYAITDLKGDENEEKCKALIEYRDTLINLQKFMIVEYK